MRRVRPPKAKNPDDQPQYDKDFAESVARNAARDRKRFGKRSKRATTGGYYSHTQKWMADNVPLDPKLLQERLDHNREYKLLQKLLAETPASRKAKMVELIRKRELPPLLAKLEEIQAEITPLVEKLCKLDTRMRRARQKVEFLKYRCKIITPESNKSIQRRLALTVRRISDGVRRQLYESNRMKIRKIHGFWKFVEKKYSRPPKT